MNTRKPKKIGRIHEMMETTEISRMSNNKKGVDMWFLGLLFSFFMPFELAKKITILSNPQLNIVLIVIPLLCFFMYLFKYHKPSGLFCGYLVYCGYHLVFGYNPDTFLIFLILPILTIVYVYETYFQREVGGETHPR